MKKLFDCHCDTLTKVMECEQNLIENNMQIDIARLSEFESATEIFAIWLDDKYLTEAYKNTNRAIDFFKSQIEKYGNYFSQVKTKEGLLNEENKVKAIVSIEGGEAIEGSIDKLYEFYEKGVRLMTLTWNHKNEIGCGALSGITDGLTDFGKSVVKEMNNMNMFIDVSHINEKGFWDVVKTTNKPIIATHSNSFTICNHPRNLKDDQLKAIAEMNGAIGLNIYPPFVRDSESVTSEDLLRHIDFILNKTGEDVLGMGTDFDGISKSPKDLEDISELPKFYDLVSKEFGEEIADKIFYKNMQKFFVENI